MNTEIKVGIFSFIILIIIGWASLKLGDLGIGPKKGYLVNAVFDSAALVDKGAPVLFAGVKIGKVETIELYNNKGRIWMRIEKDIKIPTNAIIWQRTEGFLGAKYLEIVPNPYESITGYIKEGEEIKDARMPILETVSDKLDVVSSQIEQVTYTLSKVLGSQEGEKSLATILENLKVLSDNLVVVLQGRDKQVTTIMDNLERLSTEIESLTKKNQKVIEDTLSHFPQISENFKKITSNFEEISKNFSSLVSQNRETMTNLIKLSEDNLNNLNKLLVDFQNISQGINEGKGTLGKLLKDEKLVDNLNTTIEGVNDFLFQLSSIKTYIGIRSEYMANLNDTKTYISLTLRPKLDKYYIFQVIDSPSGLPKYKDIVTSTEIYDENEIKKASYTTYQKEEKIDTTLLFSLQLAKRYKDITLRGGLIESTGGVGIDYSLFKEKLTFSFEGSGFAYKTRPHLKFSSTLTLFNHIDLVGGIDEVINSDNNNEFNFFVGGGIHFEDNDLTTLLSKIPLPSF